MIQREYILTEEVRRMPIISIFCLDFSWMILHNSFSLLLRLSDNFCGIHLYVLHHSRPQPQGLLWHSSI